MRLPPELEMRLRRDAQELDGDFPSVDNLERRILARVAITTRERRSALTGPQELALAGLLVVAVALLAVGMAHLHAMTRLAPARTPSPAPLASAVSLSSIHMITPLVGWADGTQPGLNGSVTSFLVLRTTDGGAHWRNVTPPRPWRPDSTEYLDAETAWAASFSPGRYVSVMRTTDGGTLWRETRIADQSAVGPAFFSFLDADRGWMLVGFGSVAAAEGAALYQTTDGGASWQQIAVTPAGAEAAGLPFEGHKDGISFISPQTGWIPAELLGQKPSIFVTHDGGRSWVAQDLTYPPGLTLAPGLSISAPQFFSSTSAEFHATGDRTIVFVTRDGGASWQPHVAPAAGVTFFVDANTGWLMSADGATLYRTSDGGRNWQAQQMAVALGRVSRLDFATPQLGYATIVRSNGGPSLMKTTDGGVTWSQLPTRVS